MRCVSRWTTGITVLLTVAGSAVWGQEAGPSPEAVLQRLKEGNTRFATDHPAAKEIGAKRRAELREGQHPVAAILSCSDSRVVPEIVFDQGLGDRFVIRLAD